MKEAKKSKHRSPHGEIDHPILINRTANGYWVTEDRNENTAVNPKTMMFCFESLPALCEWLGGHFPEPEDE